MKNLKEIKINGNLESMVYTLLAARARGELVFCNFGGYMLYSDTIDMDEAYLVVYGVTKDKWDFELQKQKVQRAIEKVNEVDKVERAIEKANEVDKVERAIEKAKEIEKNQNY